MHELAIALALHTLAAVAWVGGMAFAYAFLRPAAAEALEGPERLVLWQAVFRRFFPVVWISIGVLLATGYYMTLGPFGGFSSVGMHVHLMHGLALVMTAVFAHVYFAPWRRFRRAVRTDERKRAGGELDRIRKLVALNLSLGLILVAIASGGRYVG